jgi:ubiquinone/menaquinone biosynthesis C-methylase UbiE
MAGEDHDEHAQPGHSHHPGAFRHGHRDPHEHGVMSGFIVRPYDVVVGGLLMRGTYAAIARLLGGLTPTGGTVLDIGTGPGRVPVLLARRRSDVTVIGVDPSADMLERARRRARGLSTVQFIQTGAESLPLDDRSVDAVVSSLSSHHWADRSTALTEQVRVLKPGARFWLFDLKRHLADDTHAAVVRSGLALLDEPSPLGRGARRRFAVIAAVKPG